MTQGAPDSPVRGTTGQTVSETMSNKNTERGEKRGVLGTSRATQLDKTKDADAQPDRANDNDEDDAEG